MVSTKFSHLPYMSQQVPQASEGTPGIQSGLGFAMGIINGYNL
jgi:hypothetical protein